ncbi:hypothetical protein GCM10007100_09770 [Roseibacillus persicicus]|uniref:Uncharacterized protein n=1 Tax=Roseibacillus persicicus TaxID=454148 RepID=A0A918THI0_9BACT|nr:hypothetical protein GCM10007100_09770 [Roseibacillus persicicus]
MPRGITNDSEGTAANFAIIVKFAGAFGNRGDYDFEAFPTGGALDGIGTDVADHERNESLDRAPKGLKNVAFVLHSLSKGVETLSWERLLELNNH